MATRLKSYLGEDKGPFNLYGQYHGTDLFVPKYSNLSAKREWDDFLCIFTVIGISTRFIQPYSSWFLPTKPYRRRASKVNQG